MGECKPSHGNEKTPKLKETEDETRHVVSPQKVTEKEISAKFAADVSEATNKLSSLKEPTLQRNAQLVENQRKHNFSPSTGNINSLVFYIVMFDFFDGFVDGLLSSVDGSVLQCRV